MLQHPYFRKHVRHLVWDSSYWRRDVAENLDEYGREYEKFPHPMRHETPSVDQQVRDDEAAFDALLRWDPRGGQTSTKPGALPGDNFRFQWFGAGCLESDDHDFQRKAVGIAVYHRRYRHQRLSKDRHLARRYIHLAFARCPRLVHLSYTDYRALSRHGDLSPTLSPTVRRHAKPSVDG